MTLAPVLVAAFVATAGPSRDVRYVDASLAADGELIATDFVDVDADGRVEVCLAVRTQGGQRQLSLHRIEKGGVSPTPFRTVPVLDDALAFGFADVRAEPGRELFFLTRNGAWSYSLQFDGYRDNVTRLVEAQLVYDVPDPRELPVWKYVLAGANGDRLILPGRETYALWSRAGAATTAGSGAAYVLATEFTPTEPVARKGGTSGRANGGRQGRESTQVSLGPGGFVVTRDDDAARAPFLADLDEGTGALLASRRSYAAPALLDVNGDGRSDLLTFDGTGLRVHLAQANGHIAATPTRVEPTPIGLESGELTLRFEDLDGDGDPDLVARRSEAGDGLDNRVIELHLFVNDGAHLFAQKPRQILRFEAAALRYHVTDVDGDGLPDLAVREFAMPSLLETVTGLEFTLTHLLYPGEKGARPFARKPVMKQTETFDENTIQEAIKNRELALDCDGDGICDLVEVDLEGRIAIRRLLRKKSFFGGESWRLETSPWRRFDVFGSVSSVDVRDLNGDGLGDIVSAGPATLTLLLSSRTEGP